MFVFKKKRSGNRYTLASIVLILIIIYVFKMVSPQKEVTYPDIIQYNDFRYQYTETLKGSPIMYTRERAACEEGFLILTRRGVHTSEEVYIYEGRLKYRRYVVLKE